MTSDELRGAIKLIANAPSDENGSSPAVAVLSEEKFQVALLVGYEIALQLAIMNERAAKKADEKSAARQGARRWLIPDKAMLECLECRKRFPWSDWHRFYDGSIACPGCKCTATNFAAARGVEK